MATSGGSGSGGALPTWRSLGAQARFAVLLNHYQNAANLSAATGIPIKSLRSVFAVIQQGKRSKILESDLYVSGFQRARRRMTDQMRRQIKQAGNYKSPLFRTSTNNIVPETHQLAITYRDQNGIPKVKVVESFWTAYHVEHLHEDTIFAMAREMFDVFMSTDQYNTFRFEYIADADVYSDGRTFRDEGLYQQAKEYEVIRLSTHSMGFPIFRGDPEFFEDYIRDTWKRLQAKGAIRIVELLWTKMDSLEGVMPQVRRDYKRLKTRDGKSKKGGRGFT